MLNIFNSIINKIRLASIESINNVRVMVDIQGRSALPYSLNTLIITPAIIMGGTNGPTPSSSWVWQLYSFNSSNLKNSFEDPASSINYLSGHTTNEAQTNIRFKIWNPKTITSLGLGGLWHLRMSEATVLQLGIGAQAIFLFNRSQAPTPNELKTIVSTYQQNDYMHNIADKMNTEATNRLSQFFIHSSLALTGISYGLSHYRFHRIAIPVIESTQKLLSASASPTIEPKPVIRRMLTTETMPLEAKDENMALVQAAPLESLDEVHFQSLSACCNLITSILANENLNTTNRLSLLSSVTLQLKKSGHGYSINDCIRAVLDEINRDHTKNKDTERDSILKIKNYISPTTLKTTRGIEYNANEIKELCLGLGVLIWYIQNTPSIYSSMSKRDYSALFYELETLKSTIISPHAFSKLDDLLELNGFDTGNIYYQTTQEIKTTWGYILKDNPQLLNKLSRLILCQNFTDVTSSEIQDMYQQFSSYLMNLSGREIRMMQVNSSLNYNLDHIRNLLHTIRVFHEIVSLIPDINNEVILKSSQPTRLQATQFMAAAIDIKVGYLFDNTLGFGLGINFCWKDKGISWGIAPYIRVMLCTLLRKSKIVYHGE